jgi:hypothetical protein
MELWYNSKIIGGTHNQLQNITSGRKGNRMGKFLSNTEVFIITLTLYENNRKENVCVVIILLW